MSKVKKKFAQVKADKVEIYCKPEVFVLGCFFEPSNLGREAIQTYLRSKLGQKFTDFGVQQEMLCITYQWFLPSVVYSNSRIKSITDRFWNTKNAGTMAHKLPTLRDKDFQDKLGISKRTSISKMQSLVKTGLIKSYVDEGKAINSSYSNVRYVQLNVPKFLNIAYDKIDIGVVFSLLLERRDESKFFQDVYTIIEKAHLL